MINLTKEAKTIRQELFSHIESVQDEYIEKGWLPARMNLNNGVIRGLLEIFIWGIWQLYQFLQLIMQQVTPNKANGVWLDMHASGVDLTRKRATKAEGRVVFTRNATNTNNIKIPAGKIIRTPADIEGQHYRFITTEETVLPAGVESVSVPVIAEEYGRGANATEGQICEIVTPINGIASVRNTGEWLISEGADDETDPQLFERYRLQWAAQAGVTSAAYASAALSVPGVAAVRIADQHPRGQGTIDVYILGTGGRPTDTLILAVDDAIRNAIIINDDVKVLPVETYPLTLKLTIRYFTGIEDDLSATAEAHIRARAETVSKTIGADVVLARLISDVINMPNIKDVKWVSPAADVSIPRNQIFELVGVEIAMEQTDEE